jgi:hypothetical protein
MAARNQREHDGLLRQYFPKGTDLSRWSRRRRHGNRTHTQYQSAETLGWRTLPEPSLSTYTHSITHFINPVLRPPIESAMRIALSLNSASNSRRTSIAVPPQGDVSTIRGEAHGCSTRKLRDYWHVNCRELVMPERQAELHRRKRAVEQVPRLRRKGPIRTTRAQDQSSPNTLLARLRQSDLPVEDGVSRLYPARVVCQLEQSDVFEASEKALRMSSPIVATCAVSNTRPADEWSACSNNATVSAVVVNSIGRMHMVRL